MLAAPDLNPAAKQRLLGWHGHAYGWYGDYIYVCIHVYCIHLYECICAHIEIYIYIYIYRHYNHITLNDIQLASYRLRSYVVKRNKHRNEKPTSFVVRWEDTTFGHEFTLKEQDKIRALWGALELHHTDQTAIDNLPINKGVDSELAHNHT